MTASSRSPILIAKEQKSIIDILEQSNELISIFSEIILECPSCSSKLNKSKKKKAAEGHQPSTPTGHKTTDDDTTPALQARGNINHHD